MNFQITAVILFVDVQRLVPICQLVRCRKEDIKEMQGKGAKDIYIFFVYSVLVTGSYEAHSRFS